MNFLIVDKIIKDALIEDGAFEDVTTLSVVAPSKKATVNLIAKEDGVICGLDIFRRVYDILGEVEVTYNYSDSDQVSKGDIIGQIKGNARTVLSGERVALNLLQRMSGIATMTRKIVNLLNGTNIKILDTRKTTPNLRYLEKYSVKQGGGSNHRYNLSDMAMIKDNHIKACGTISDAVRLVRENYPFVKKVEVECESLEEVKEAVAVKTDIIMLDNMDYNTMKEAISIINKQAFIEVSGNIDAEKVAKLKDLDIDYFSSGALTHSVKALDISMKNLEIF